MQKPFYKASHGAYYWRNDQNEMVRLGTHESEAYAGWERLRKAEPAAEAPAPAAPAPAQTISPVL